MRPRFPRFSLFPATMAMALAGVLVAATPGYAAITGLEATEVPSATAKQARVLNLIAQLIEKSHYRKQPLDDSFSALVLRAYLDKLDPAKSIFTQTDVAQFEKLRHRFDDFIREGNVQPAFTIYSVFRTRLEERVEYALARLDEPLDFALDEEYPLDRKAAQWATDSAQLDDLWRRRIKNDIIGLRLAGKGEEELFATLKRRYTHLARRTRQFKSEDVFQTFVNAYVNNIDPHTSYFSARASENFHIQMRLSLEGIGAVLQTDDEHTLVRRIIPGGPADLAGELGAEDRIIGVGQGGQEIVDVIGWRLGDVVALIRGPKASIVRLEIVPGGGGGNDVPSRVIEIRRDKINLDDQAAKQRILTLQTERGEATIGVIDLPSFYIDFNGLHQKLPDYRSTTRDVRKLLAEFRAQPGGIDGLIIDLRGNGGGALTEAISLTGLFIPQGPVVQVQNSGGAVQIDRDPDPELVYDGPLAVLVDRHSASASEIFAGAIQDYRRGLIIGEPTYGKGTVQHLVNLNRFAKGEDGLGQLKVTIAQFFRINGGSTQHMGVIPDIVWPTANPDDRYGERAYDNALPWRQIDGAAYEPFRDELGAAVFARMRELHARRVQASPEFQYFIDVAKINAERGDKKTVALNQDLRERERAKRDRQQLELENRMRRALGRETAASMESLAQENEEQSGAGGGGDVEEEPDAHLREGGNILSDYLFLLESQGAAVATKNKPVQDGLLSD